MSARLCFLSAVAHHNAAFASIRFSKYVLKASIAIPLYHHISDQYCSPPPTHAHPVDQAHPVPVNFASDDILEARFLPTASTHSCSVAYQATALVPKLSNCHTFQGLLFLAPIHFVHIELSAAIIVATINGSTLYFCAVLFTISAVICVHLYLLINASSHIFCAL